MTAGVLATCTVQSGYLDRSTIILDLAGSLLQVLERPCSACRWRRRYRSAAPFPAGGRPGRACGRAASISSDGLFNGGTSISGLSYQVIRVRGTPPAPHRPWTCRSASARSRCPCAPGLRHQSFLMVFRLFEMPIFLPFRYPDPGRGCRGHARPRSRLRYTPSSHPRSTVRRRCQREHELGDR